MRRNKPERWLTKLELAQELGFAIIPYEFKWAYQLYPIYVAIKQRDKTKDENCWRKYIKDPWFDTIIDKKYKENVDTINARMRKVIDNITRTERNRKSGNEDVLQIGPPEKSVRVNDLLVNCPIKTYRLKSNTYDRNQFIRSYFRYKNCKIKNDHLFIENREIDLEYELAHYKRPVKSNDSEINPVLFIFDKLYSVTRIIEECYPPCASKDYKTDELEVIQLPLHKSVIEKIAKTYQFDFIELADSDSKYLYVDDLKYLDEHTACLKLRESYFSSISSGLQDPNKYTDENDIFYNLKGKESIQADHTQNTLKHTKYTFPKDHIHHSNLRKLITVVSDPANFGTNESCEKKDAEIIKKILPLKYRKLVKLQKPAESTVDYWKNLIKKFFTALLYADQGKDFSAEKISIIYETEDEISAQIGYAKYDESDNAVIIDRNIIKSDQILCLIRLHQY